jgi:hypothetical protein
MPDRKNRDRWAILSGLDIGADGDPFLDRLRLVQTPWFGIYLHHIHRPDRDPDPHNHPWWFASIVLSGAYVEDVWPVSTIRRGTVTRHRPRWSLRKMPRHSAHLITEVTGPLWTLVLVGPKRSDWGFWTPGGFVPWRDYIERVRNA